MSFSQLSLQKTKGILGERVDLSQELEYDDSIDGGDGYDTPEEAHDASSQSNADRKLLLSQARAFREFEKLFVALDALERWRVAAGEVIGSGFPM